MIYQMQPHYKDGNEVLQFATDNHLRFEVLEFFSPPLLNDDSAWAYAKQWYHDCTLVESVHGAFIDMNPSSGDKTIREYSRAMYRKSCELAEYLGAKNVIFHSCAFPFLRGHYIENYLDASCSFYEELLKEYGLTFYVENSFDLDLYPIKTLVDRINSPRVKVCLDIGHANYSRVPPVSWIEQLHKRIGYIHLSDNLGAFDDHLSLEDGTVDWKQIYQACDFLPNNTPFTLEIGTAEQLRSSIDYLKKLHKF